MSGGLSWRDWYSWGISPWRKRQSFLTHFPSCTNWRQRDSEGGTTVFECGGRGKAPLWRKLHGFENRSKSFSYVASRILIFFDERQNIHRRSRKCPVLIDEQIDISLPVGKHRTSNQDKLFVREVNAQKSSHSHVYSALCFESRSKCRLELSDWLTFLVEHLLLQFAFPRGCILGERVIRTLSWTYCW